MSHTLVETFHHRLVRHGTHLDRVTLRSSNVSSYHVNESCHTSSSVSHVNVTHVRQVRSHILNESCHPPCVCNITRVISKCVTHVLRCVTHRVTHLQCVISHFFLIQSMGSFLIHINELLRRNVILASSFISYVLPNQWAHSSFISMSSFLIHINELIPHSYQWASSFISHVLLIQDVDASMSSLMRVNRLFCVYGILHVCDVCVTCMWLKSFIRCDRDVTVTWPRHDSFKMLQVLYIILCQRLSWACVSVCVWMSMSISVYVRVLVFMNV